MPVWAKLAYATGLTPLVLVILRTFIAGFVLLGFFAIRRQSIRIPHTSRKHVAVLCWLYAAMMITYFIACQNLDSGVANAVFHLYPVIIIVLSLFLKRSRLDVGKVIAATLAVAGFVLLANYGGETLSVSSMVLAVISATLFALYSLMLDTSNVKGIDSFILTFYVCITSCFASSVLWLLDGASIPYVAPEGLIYALLIGLFSTVCALALYIKSTQILGPIMASVLSNIEVVITFVMGIWLLSESVETATAMGCALVVIACIMTCIPSRQSAKTDLSKASEADASQNDIYLDNKGEQNVRIQR